MLEFIQKQEKVIKTASESGDYEAVVEANDKVESVVKDVIDLVLGEGSFDKLMDAADDEIDLVVGAFLEVADQYKSFKQNKSPILYRW